MKKLDTETVVYEGDGMTLECEVSDREAEVFWSRMGKVRILVAKIVVVTKYSLVSTLTPTEQTMNRVSLVA